MKTSDKSVQLHRRANMALDFFEPKEQEEVKQAVASLANRSEGSHPDDARRISAVEPMFVARVSPDIRVIFRKTPDGIVVEDFVRRETLDAWARAASNGAATKPRLNGPATQVGLKGVVISLLRRWGSKKAAVRHAKPSES